MKKNILIYNDLGVGKSVIGVYNMLSHIVCSNRYKIMQINSDQINAYNDLWHNNASLFVMPGGQDLPYCKKLNGIGNESIKDFVKKGGSYLGICAGAYYASSYVEFDKDGPLQVLGERELCFYERIAVGPIFKRYNYFYYSGAKVAGLNTIFPSLPTLNTLYNGGCYFKDVSGKLAKDCTIFACYNQLSHNNLQALAIIGKQYNLGKVVLSGVHFEYPYFCFQCADPYLKKKMYNLRMHNASNIKLAKYLLNFLNINTRSVTSQEYFEQNHHKNKNDEIAQSLIVSNLEFIHMWNKEDAIV